MNKKKKLIIFSLFLIFLLFLVKIAGAQDLGIETMDEGLDGALGEAGTDPRMLVARIIQIALGFLGILALSLVLYAGFLWMTSAGNEEKIDKAKGILKNAVIGLIIIMSSWGIVTFIIYKLGQASGSLAPVIPFRPAPPGEIGSHGFGAIGNCALETVYPENNQRDVPRNTAIIINFKEEISSEGLCVNQDRRTCECGTKGCDLLNPNVIRVYREDLGDSCGASSCPSHSSNVVDINLSISLDEKTIFLVPKAYLGEQNNQVKYLVKLTDQIKGLEGQSVFRDCATKGFVWGFEVGGRLDLTPPQTIYRSLAPRPDNEKDSETLLNPAEAAEAVIEVLSCPQVYQSAKILSVESRSGGNEATAGALTYKGELTKFIVQITSGDNNRAQLFDDNNNLLGAADFDSEGTAKFSPFFVLTAPERQAGNSWLVTMQPERSADTLTIGGDIYTFSPNAGGSYIQYPEDCRAEKIVENIYVALSGSEQVELEKISDTRLKIKAKQAGNQGNNLKIAVSNQEAIRVVSQFSGGVDRSKISRINHRQDVPMNTVIQLNFDKTMNPLQISGLAKEVADYVRVINYNSQAKLAGETCLANEECRSYKCEGLGEKVCVGDYLAGKFMLSNQFRTLEFISDETCGVNACGEEIYCLPPNSHLLVELEAADLKTCYSNDDCLSYAPYSLCRDSGLGYNTCQNSEGKNYPMANIVSNGLTDASLNSLDGNRDRFADGPLNYHNDNHYSEEQQSDSAANQEKDSYHFSFFVSDKLNLDPPVIEEIGPGQDEYGVKSDSQIKIVWNTLMMNSSLTTGSRIIDTGKNKTVHKMINLRSGGDSRVGYWITNNNEDINNDSEPDRTVTYLNHTPLLESMNYQAQVGSGVKDIYQNCYKPSAGAGCQGVSVETPSCCYGLGTSELNDEGNCY